MSDFVGLFHELSETASTGKKTSLLVQFFRSSSPEDLKWAICILCGANPPRTVRSKEMREWAGLVSGVPSWLVEESYHVVGDLAETASLLVSHQATSKPMSLSEWISELQSLRGKFDDERKRFVMEKWQILSGEQCIVFNKLITGGLRVGVAKGLVLRAIAQFYDVDQTKVAHKLMGVSCPEDLDLEELANPDARNRSSSLSAYPFFLAHSAPSLIDELGDPKVWLAEWKWDGIRSQIVVRNREIALWSRGEELVLEAFPEFAVLKEIIPDGTVLDGEILAVKDKEPASFAALQKRLNRKKVTPKTMKDTPVGFVAYDLLEENGEDIREHQLSERRARLSMVVARIIETSSLVRLSPLVTFGSWAELLEKRAQSRERKVEGLMLKRLDSSYGVGRKRGGWWKWKVDPLTCDGVLVYAQKGHGQRADLYTDYTFAVWNGGILVPFAKAYSGLTNGEIREVDAFVKSHTKEKFGPVRTVHPELVFEIAFEGIQLSSRHKSGVAVRFPRILRWRKDKIPAEADSLSTLAALAEISK